MSAWQLRTRARPIHPCTCAGPAHSRPRRSPVLVRSFTSPLMDEYAAIGFELRSFGRGEKIRYKGDGALDESSKPAAKRRKGAEGANVPPGADAAKPLGRRSTF